MKARTLILMLAAVAVTTIVLLGGCKKKEQPAPTKVPTMEEATKTAAKTAEEAEKEATAVTEEAKKTAEAAAAEIEQTMCPIMDGNKIDKNVFVEYQGKKVYFCCPDCKAKFQAEPEKYIAKLPQFKQ